MFNPCATIVIPQRGHVELTLACLKTLRVCDSTCWPIIVVDDGSPTADERAIQEVAEISGVRVIRQSQRGVTSAWNIGWKNATTESVIFLNNDVVCRGEWVARLLTPLVNGAALMTGARMRREEFLPRAFAQRLPTQDVLEGWCFAIGRQTLEQLEGFDPQLTTYWSDTDLQLRLVERNAPRAALLALPDLPLDHIGHATARDASCFPRRREVWQADRARFIAKWDRHCIPVRNDESRK